MKKSKIDLKKMFPKTKTAKIIIIVVTALLVLAVVASVVFTRPYFTKRNQCAVQAVMAAEEYADTSAFYVNEIRYLKNDFSSPDYPYIYYIQYSMKENPKADELFIIEVRSGDRVSGSTKNLESDNIFKSGKAKFIEISWKSAEGKNLNVKRIESKVKKALLEQASKEEEEKVKESEKE